jgi:hypothetical protein
MHRLKPIAQAVLVAFPQRQADPLDLVQRLPAGEVLSLEIAHVDTLNQIAHGAGTAQTLWDWTANCLTWSRAADLAGLGQDEMGFQLQLCLDLIARWKRTGRVAFDGPGYQLAKHGIDVMDELARQVTVHVFRDAVAWSNEQLARMRADDERKVA